MSKNRLSLGQLLKRISGSVDLDTDTADTSTTTTKESSEGDADPDQETDETDTKTADSDTKTADSDKKVTDSETKDADLETEGKKSAIVAASGSVSMSLADYTALVGFASESTEMKAENSKLKVKADQWDAYQAALKGGKPDADTIGADADDKKVDSKDPNAHLRSKHKGLMEGL